jgi:flagellar basal-body rod modification protein FlgD
MSVNSVNPAAQQQQPPQTASRRLNQNFDMFLMMLTTQLQNQNPLEPLDANKFTEQLVQYSSVEQQIAMNQSLDQLKSIVIAQNAASLVSYVGAEVTAQGNAAILKDGKANWVLSTSTQAKTMEVEIRNESGAVVATRTITPSSKDHSFEWDGKANDGTSVPPGTYRITVKAKDAQGADLPVTTKVSGIVKEIDFSTPEPTLMVNGMKIPASAILSVRR